MRITIGSIAVWFVILLAGAIGWITNIITIFHNGISPITAETALRIVGIFIAPIGAVLGYI